MSAIKDILNSIPASAKSKSHEAGKSKDKKDELMLNPEYLRHSSAVISEALQKGFDVLQLENGDIITTGTKVIVTHYHWDADKGAMSKLSARERKKHESDDEPN